MGRVCGHDAPSLAPQAYFCDECRPAYGMAEQWPDVRGGPSISERASWRQRRSADSAGRRVS